MKRESIELEPAGCCGKLPALLPDFFATDETVKPRTWRHVCITLLGIAVCGYIVFTTLVKDWVDEPYITNVELASTMGNAYNIDVRCTATLGCHVEHLYDDAACSGAVTAASMATLAGRKAERKLNLGDSASFQLCASPLYADGLLVTIPLGVESLFSPVEVRSGDTFVGLPHAPLVATADRATSKPTVVGVTLTNSTDSNGNSTAFWSFASQAASSGSRCAKIGASGSATADTGVVGVGGTGAVETAIGSACYQLRISSTATKITNDPAFSWNDLLEAWGGAYAFVFGIAAMAIFGVEKVGAVCCRSSKGEHDMSSGAMSA